MDTRKRSSDSSFWNCSFLRLYFLICLLKDSIVEPEGMENTFELYNKTTVDKLIPILVPTDLNGHDVLLRFNGFLGEDYRYLKISELF